MLNKRYVCVTRVIIYPNILFAKPADYGTECKIKIRFERIDCREMSRAPFSATCEETQQQSASQKCRFSI